MGLSSRAVSITPLTSWPGLDWQDSAGVGVGIRGAAEGGGGVAVEAGRGGVSVGVLTVFVWVGSGMFDGEQAQRMPEASRIKLKSRKMRFVGCKNMGVGKSLDFQY